MGKASNAKRTKNSVPSPKPPPKVPPTGEELHSPKFRDLVLHAALVVVVEETFRNYFPNLLPWGWMLIAMLVTCDLLQSSWFSRNVVPIKDLVPNANVLSVYIAAAIIPTALFAGYWPIINLTFSALEARKVDVERIVPQLDSSALRLDAIQRVDDFLAGKDEPELKMFFGVEELLEINIKYETDRLKHFIATGAKEFPVGPYMGDGTATVNLGLPGTQAYPVGGTTQLDTNPRMVHLAIVPKAYSDGRGLIFTYQTRIGMPQEMIGPLKQLTTVLDENVNTLIDVMNDALHTDQNYYLMRETGLPKYRFTIDQLYYKRFKPLKPQADAVRESARRVLGIIK